MLTDLAKSYCKVIFNYRIERESSGILTSEALEERMKAYGCEGLEGNLLISLMLPEYATLPTIKYSENTILNKRMPILYILAGTK